MENNIIKRFIALQLSIKNFRKDKKHFEELKFGYVYNDMLDSIIEHMEKEFYALKAKLISSYHIEVMFLGKEENVNRYKIKNKDTEKIIEFTSDELKEMTGALMKESLIKYRSSIDWKEHVWDDDGKE